MDGQPPAQSSFSRTRELAAAVAGIWSGSAILPACVLLALTLAAYLPALDAGFVFDDSVYVTKDARMESLEGLRRIWTEVGGPQYKHQYYPITTSGFWVQYQLWGADPFGYHLVNVLLHALNAVLLWRLLGALRVPGAWLGAAIFAVHPVHVQSVAWITELKNVLSTAFVLSSALVFVRWFRLDRDHRGEPEAAWRPGLYLLGLGLFVCALASKTATCLLPAALALLLWWKRDRLARRDVLALLPLFAVGVAFVAMTVYLETHYRAHGEVFGQTWLERVLIAGRSIWFYVGKLLWPVGLNFIYPRWDVDVHAWWQYLYPLAAVGTLVTLWRLRTRIGKGPVMVAAYFTLAVAPLSFVNVAYTRFSFVADHWPYWASMGFIALAAAAVVVVSGRIQATSTRRAATVGSLAVVAVLAGLTWQRCHVYRDEETLWSDTIDRNPQAWAAHNNLALALGSTGRLDEAIDHFRQSVTLNPGYAEGFNNLGAALMLQDRLDEAATACLEAIRLEPDLPGAHFNLALIRRSQGWLDDAIRHYREAHRYAPGSAETLTNLGEALETRGDTDKAMASYRAALDITPDDALANFRLGCMLLAAEQLDEAIACYRTVLENGPDDAGVYYNLGIALARQGKLDEAIVHYEAALEIRPDFFEVHVNLGIALQAAGYPPQAIDHYLEAVRINPDHFGARYNLGLALTRHGDPEGAIRHYRRCVELEPDHARAHYKLGSALAAVGRHDAADPHFREAQRLDPDLPAPPPALVMEQADG
jgi:tetratricopeptide (TPR) repeat protein